MGLQVETSVDSDIPRPRTQGESSGKKLWLLTKVGVLIVFLVSISEYLINF